MESLGIDIKLLIAQLINFGLFLFIFKKYIAKPFSDFLNLEIKKEKEKERILSELAKKQELVEKKAGKAKEKMKKEYDVAIQQARQEALVLRNQLVAAAKKEADDIIEKSKRQISEERSRPEKKNEKKNNYFTGFSVK